MDDTTTPPRVGVDELLAAAAQGAQGWSDRFGGPAGVERLTVALQDQLKQQAAALAILRGQALRELLTTRSVTSVAAERGMSRAAIAKAAKPVDPTQPEPRTW